MQFPLENPCMVPMLLGALLRVFRKGRKLTWWATSSYQQLSADRDHHRSISEHLAISSASLTEMGLQEAFSLDPEPGAHSWEEIPHGCKGWLYSPRWKGDHGCCPHWLFLLRAGRRGTHAEIHICHFQATAQAKQSGFSALPTEPVELCCQEKEKMSTARFRARIEVESHPMVVVLCTHFSTKRKLKCATQKRALVGHWKLAQHTLAEWAVFVQRGLSSGYMCLLGMTSSRVSTQLSGVFRSYF